MGRISILLTIFLTVFALVGIQTLFSLNMGSMKMDHDEMSSSHCVSVCLADAVVSSTTIVSVLAIVAVLPILFLAFNVRIAPPLVVARITYPPDPRRRLNVVRRE